MKSVRYGALGEALRDIDSVFGEPPSWEELIHRAREADLLGTLAYRIEERGRMHDVPAAPRAHLAAARNRCIAQRSAVEREVREVASALRPLGVPMILLKGAAYLLADLPPSRGRVFSDVDILVPKSGLPAVESALMLAGFATTHLHPYDQRYYRRWMHELPPMQHIRRLTVLDVHHAILPETARVHPDPAALFRASVPLAGWHGVSLLAPTDIVLHSATHLFHNEELTHGLRDLVDIDALLRHFGARAHFWPELMARAAELELERPLYYALHWTNRILGTNSPQEVRAAIRRLAPNPLVRALMGTLFQHALRPTAARASTRWSRRSLYVRGHWLKMPVPLLAWHLTVKSLRRDEQPA